jgi:hypothetical protein
MTRSLQFFASIALVMGAFACASSVADGRSPATTALASTAPTATMLSAGCKLPAPKPSDDACTTDDDCGVSTSCHADSCVSKAKSHPKASDTVCTESLACFSADVNRCGCYQGHCALIPPS